MHKKFIAGLLLLTSAPLLAITQAQEDFLSAAARGDVAKVTAGIQAGYAGVVDGHGMTALHYAASNDCRDVVVELVRAGAKVNPISGIPSQAAQRQAQDELRVQKPLHPIAATPLDLATSQEVADLLTRYGGKHAGELLRGKL